MDMVWESQEGGMHGQMEKQRAFQRDTCWKAVVEGDLSSWEHITSGPEAFQDAAALYSQGGL